MRTTAIAALAGYLIGTMPSADIATRLASSPVADLRTAGSGNPGALNTATLLGTRWGAAVLVADMAKGAAAATKRNAEHAVWVSSVVWVVAAVVWWRRPLPNAWGPAPTGGLPLFALSGPR